MIVALIALGGAALAAVSWLLVRYYVEEGKHSGAGEGALTVRHLLDQAAAESARRPRHLLREPVTLRGDLADDLAVVETRFLPLVETGLPLGEADCACHPGMLRRVLVGLERA
ncbi:hypothetical protein [Saccharopolyspora phatthalungensis]|uniref:Uncharacterized protein n=1 Tax=Saccharopolyspora phatthalungensis TaxID=664693 RepID=A0A840Q363_9PSEU|nr:hypothetical protein [Saccharopolyspora phatthalungensis]MBB5154934.1 hypothetical protein [Saccharopolyspora phatthalungensis]